VSAGTHRHGDVEVSWSVQIKKFTSSSATSCSNSVLSLLYRFDVSGV
jgi:hypothetical protein